MRSRMKLSLFSCLRPVPLSLPTSQLSRRKRVSRHSLSLLEALALPSFLTERLSDAICDPKASTSTSLGRALETPTRNFLLCFLSNNHFPTSSLAYARFSSVSDRGRRERRTYFQGEAVHWTRRLADCTSRPDATLGVFSLYIWAKLLLRFTHWQRDPNCHFMLNDLASSI